MKLIRINLKDKYPSILDHDVFLDGCLYDDSHEYGQLLRKSVLVLPGGGYAFVSYREKDPIMFAFLAEGFNAFSLTYSCFTPYPVPYLEVFCAMKYINSHAKKFNLEPNAVSLVGFSAGGHLAASYASIYHSFCKRQSEIMLARPYALILGYPVISLIKTNNPNCVENISHHDEKIMHLLSPEEHVDKDYPPTFMWTTKTDKVVNPNNVKWLEKQLIKHHIKHQCIMFKSGPHGLSLANLATATNRDFLQEDVAGWPALAAKFIYSL